MKSLVFLLTLLLGTVFASTAEAGTFESTGTTTDATSTEADPKRPVQTWGTLSITAVKVNGVVKTVGVDYTLQDDGTSEAKVIFSHALPLGAVVDIYGTTSQAGEHLGSVTFS